MPAVYKTGHEIADRVAKSVAISGYEVRKVPNSFYDFESSDCHIAYGILRGTANLFAAARAKHERFVFLDKGFFKPNHFDGYYRFGINRFQQSYAPHCLPVDRLELIMGREKVLKEQTPRGREVLVIAPTEAVCEFYNLGSTRIWLQNMLADLAERTDRPISVRFKTTCVQLDEHLANAYCVVTHSSSVAWEALRRGIPAIAQVGSIVHDWNGLTIDDLEHEERISVNDNEVMSLMTYMAHYQFTLDEIEQGKARHLIEGVA